MGLVIGHTVEHSGQLEYGCSNMHKIPYLNNTPPNDLMYVFVVFF